MIFIVLLLLLIAFLVILARRKSKDGGSKSLAALAPLIVAADHGDPNALHQLNAARDRLHLSDEAFAQYRHKLYLRYAQNGDAFAEYQLGEEAIYLLNQPRAGYDHLQRAAARGRTEAMVTLALLYSTGSHGFEENLPLSFEWYMRAANAGNAKAMAEVSSCYRTGCGVGENREAAISWATKGANMGSAECVFALSECYEMPPSPGNIATRLRYLEQAIRMGNREIYEKSANALGGVFGASYLYRVPANSFTDRRKAAYCFSLAWFCDPDDDIVKEKLQKIGYPASQQELAQWRADANTLRYNP